MFLSVFCNKVMQSMKPLHGWDPRGRVLFVASGALPSYTAYMTANKSHLVKQFSQAYPVKHVASSQSSDLSCSPTQPTWLLTKVIQSGISSQTCCFKSVKWLILLSYTAYMTANKSHSVKQFSQAYPVKHIASSQSSDLSCSPTQPSWLLTQSFSQA